MKKIIFGCFISFALISCNKTESGENSNDSATVNHSTEIANHSSKVEETGKVLIENSDCVSCHQKDAKLVGPSYKEIAAKYPADEKNIDKLADKIITGAVGTWGQIPMPAHPSLSKEDAKEMVKYILSNK